MAFTLLFSWLPQTCYLMRLAKILHRKLKRKGYTIKLKRNAIIWLPSYFGMENKMMLLFEATSEMVTIPSPTSRSRTKYLLLFLPLNFVRLVCKAKTINYVRIFEVTVTVLL